MQITDIQKQAFDKDMRSIYEQSKKLGYNATIFFRMINQYGAYDAACRLINQNEIPYGLVKLCCEMKRPDLSMEYYIVKKWNTIFEEEQVKICRERLEQCGYKID